MLRTRVGAIDGLSRLPGFLWSGWWSSAYPDRERRAAGSARRGAGAEDQAAMPRPRRGRAREKRGRLTCMRLLGSAWKETRLVSSRLRSAILGLLGQALWGRAPLFDTF